MTAPQLTQYINGRAQVTADMLNTFQQTCDTFADLRAFVGTTGMQVSTRGGIEINDGLQGIFYWNALSTALDDDETVIAPAGAGAIGRWVLVQPVMPEFAFVTMTNVGAYADKSVAVIGNYVAREGTIGALHGSGAAYGLGPSYGIRSHLITAVNATVAPFDRPTIPESGATVAGDEIFMNVGGLIATAVPVGYQAVVKMSTPWPQHPNPNVVGFQSFVIADCNASTTNNVTAFFGGGDFVVATHNATNFILCGREIDYGFSNFGNGALAYDISGLSLINMGNGRPPLPNYGASVGLNIASGGQMAGNNNQQRIDAGVQVGINFTDSLGFVPIHPSGFLMLTIGTWNVLGGIDMSSVNFTGAPVASDHGVIMGRGNPGLNLSRQKDGGGGIRFDDGSDVVVPAAIYSDKLGGLVFPPVVGFGKFSVGPTALVDTGTTLADLQACVIDIRDLLINVGLGVAP